jgi:hypothetical protein
MHRFGAGSASSCVLRLDAANGYEHRVGSIPLTEPDGMLLGIVSYIDVLGKRRSRGVPSD